MKKEILLSLKNTIFVIPSLLLVGISIMHGILTIKEYSDFTASLTMADLSNGNLCFPIYTSFNLWIGNSNSILSLVVFYIAPFSAALPYSWSYCRDKQSPQKQGKQKYVFRVISVFVSSGLMIAIPLIVNFILISLFIPSIKPDSVYNYYYGIFSNNCLGNMFYNAPYFYILYYIILNFIVWGLLGCLGLSFSTIVDSKFMAVFFPIMIIIAIEVLKKALSNWTHVEVSLLSYLYPANPFYDNCFVLLFEVAILIILSYILSRNGVKNEK